MPSHTLFYYQLLCAAIISGQPVRTYGAEEGESEMIHDNIKMTHCSCTLRSRLPGLGH